MTDLERIEVDLTVKLGIDYDPRKGLSSALRKGIDSLGEMSMFVTSAGVANSGGGILGQIDTPENIKDLVKDGLCTDGGHHKQWYLEEVLKLLGYKIKEIREELVQNGYFAEEGVAP
jgi:hypothetical protein